VKRGTRRGAKEERGGGDYPSLFALNSIRTKYNEKQWESWQKAKEFEVSRNPMENGFQGGKKEKQVEKNRSCWSGQSVKKRKQLRGKVPKKSRRGTIEVEIRRKNFVGLTAEASRERSCSEGEEGGRGEGESLVRTEEPIYDVATSIKQSGGR